MGRGVPGGVSRAATLLDRLVEESRAEVEVRKAAVPLDRLERRARAIAPARNLRGALRGDRLAVIAEMKARTPLLGRLSDTYSPAKLAAAYAGAGAAALSVLCQATSFGGRPEHVAEAREAAELPILRKDFVVDEYQLVEARAFGADSVLLIAAVLDRKRLGTFLDLARGLGMEPLVEVHDEAEVESALAAGAAVVGVNHRDLATFQVDLGLTGHLRRLLPPDVVVVAESGIRTADDARRVRAAGADAILVGEALMRASDPARKLRELAV